MDISKYYSSLANGIKLILTKQKISFYGYILLTIQKEFSELVPTAGVGLFKRNVKLVINPKFWNDDINMTKNDQYLYLLAHEAMHIMHQHMFVTEGKDHMLHNEAADLYQNTILNDILGEDAMPGCGNTKDWNDIHKPLLSKLEEKLKAEEITIDEFKIQYAKIPIRGIHIEDYSHIPEFTKNNVIDKGSEWIYQILLKNKQENDENKLNQELKFYHDNELSHPSNHSDWKQVNVLSDGEKKFISSQINENIKNAFENSNIGINNLPSNIKDILDKILFPAVPVFNYSQYLKNWINTYGDYTLITRTRLRPNLIIPDGWRLKLSPNKHIVCFLDTSGSMSTDDIIQSLIELYHIRNLQDFSITVVEIDTEVTDVWELKDVADINTKITTKGITGRGGTTFDAGIQYTKDNPIYSGAIYFTDGGVNEPQEKMDIPLLIVVTSTGSKIKWKNTISVKIPKDYYKNKN